MNSIIKALPEIKQGIQNLQEILLANAVMFGEIPAPTGHEQARVRFMLDRFHECGCQSVCEDEAGNAMGVLPGKKGERNILIAAHLDTPFKESVDHTITVHKDRLEGPGILDNSVGLAAVVSLPTLLENLRIELDDNLILMGSSRSLGDGDIAGMQFFLKHNTLPIRAGILIEGGTLGRLSYASLGMLRGNITCRIPNDYNYMRYGAKGAIPVMNTIIRRLLEIPIPQEPPTRVLMGSVQAGTSYNTAATKALLQFEVSSEQAGMVDAIEKQVAGIVNEVAFSSGFQIDLTAVARRRNCNIPYNHPLVETMRTIMDSLNIRPTIAPSTGELAALIHKDIPGITVGLTQGKHRHELNESAQIETMWTGLANIIGLLTAIDGGFCDEEA